MNSIETLSLLPTTANVTTDIRTILKEARQITVQAINHTMVATYWLIGKRILIEEQ